MQTDQDEQQGQGDGNKETEDKKSENEEMEVRCSIFVWDNYRVTSLLDCLSMQGNTIQYISPE